MSVPSLCLDSIWAYVSVCVPFLLRFTPRQLSAYASFCVSGFDVRDGFGRNNCGPYGPSTKKSRADREDQIPGCPYYTAHVLAGDAVAWRSTWGYDTKGGFVMGDPPEGHNMGLLSHGHPWQLDDLGVSFVGKAPSYEGNFQAPQKNRCESTIWQIKYLNYSGYPIWPIPILLWDSFLK